MATLYKPNAFLTRPGRASVAVEAETKTKPAPAKKRAAASKEGKKQ